MSEFSIEELDKQLTHKNIKVSIGALGAESFQRKRTIVIFDNTYEIEWWANICYLLREGMIVPFKTVRQLRTWPNRAKTNLQFYNEHGDVCCVIPVELWEEGKG